MRLNHKITISRYLELGDQVIQCTHCNANMWYEEIISKHKDTQSSTCVAVTVKLNFHSYNPHRPPTIRIQGQPCHRIGSLLPMPRKEPKFAHLYIFDIENEVKNRINAMRQNTGIEANIVAGLSQMLDEHNTHAKSFRMVRDRLTQN
ncbi:hypothetical protein HKD37_04G010424 [Glycine soja]